MYPRVANYQLPFAKYQLPVANYQLPNVSYQTKTDLEQTHSRQHEVARPLIEVTADRISSAGQTDIQRVDCAVQGGGSFNL